MTKFRNFFRLLSERSSKIVSLLILLACAGGPIDPNEFKSFFMPESSNASATDLRYAFTPQFFYIDDEGYSEEDTTDAQTDENVLTWMAYSKSDDSKSIGAELFGESKVFSRFLKLKGKNEAAEYLAAAKAIEKAYQPSMYSWEESTKDSIGLESWFDKMKALAGTTKDSFLKERYAFQAIKLAGILQKHQECVKLYDQWIAPIKQKTFISDWSLSRKAGADMRLGDSAKAYYEFAQVFDRSASRRRQADLSIRIYGLRNFTENALSFCKNDQEKAAVYAIAAIQPRTDALPMLEKLVALNPKNPLIELIMAREINQNEFYHYTDTQQMVYTFYDADSTEMAQKKAESGSYAEKLKDFALQCAENKNLGNPVFWLTATAYMEYMGKDFEKSQELLDKAKLQKTTHKSLQDQIALQEMLLTIDRQATVTTDLETAAMPYLEQFSIANDFRRNNAFVQACTALAAKYRGIPTESETKSGGWFSSCSNKKTSPANVPFAKAKAYLMTVLPSRQMRSGESYGFEANNDMYAVEDSTSSATIQEVIAYFTQASPNDFDKRLMKIAKISQDDLYVLLGRRSLAENAFAQAAEAFGKVPTSYWEQDPFSTYFNQNPFYLSPDKEQDAAQIHTPATFTKRMAELEAKVKADPSDAEAWYLLGCGAFNLSYYGNSWVLVTRDWSNVELEYSTIDQSANNYYTTNSARRYFEQAMKMTTNTELAARACFMAAQCEQNAFFTYQGMEHAKQYAKGNYDDISAQTEQVRRQKYLTFFKLLKTQYRNTKFQQEAIRECSDYATFVAGK